MMECRWWREAVEWIHADFKANNTFLIFKMRFDIFLDLKSVLVTLSIIDERISPNMAMGALNDGLKGLFS